MLFDEKANPSIAFLTLGLNAPTLGGPDFLIIAGILILIFMRLRKRINTKGTMPIKRLAIIAAIVMIIGAFLPWVGVSSSVSGSSLGSSFDSSYSSGGLSGIAFPSGWFAIIAAIGGLVLLQKLPKLAPIPGVLCLQIGIVHMMGWSIIGSGWSVSGDTPSISHGGMYIPGGSFSGRGSTDIYYGLYVFLVAAIAYVITSTMAGFLGKPKDSPVPSPMDVAASTGERMASKSDELSKLFELKKQGVLSDEEFNQEKAKLLATQTVAPSIARDASKKVAAGVCGIFLGAFGIHKFILGYQNAGIIMLCVTLLTCGYGAFVMCPIGVIEGILYLCMSDDVFVQTYVQHKKEWF